MTNEAKRAHVSIMATYTDRGENKLYHLTQLVESVMDITECRTDRGQVTFEGITTNKLSAITAALYAKENGVLINLIHNVRYSTDLE